MSVPFEEILERLPPASKVLDIGCGHGILCNAIALHDPQAKIWGIDIDQRKINIGQKSALANQVIIEHVDRIVLPDELDVIILSDVYHHLAPSESQKILGMIKQKLKKGSGIFFLKDMDTKPLWKFLYCYIFDVLTGFLHITEGTSLNYKSADEFKALLKDAGFSIKSLEYLRPNDTVPHILIQCIVE